MIQEDKQLNESLRTFINNYSQDVDFTLDRELDPKLWFLPPVTEIEKKEAAHYFLLAAALTETKVIGNSRNVRVLLCHLHDKLIEELYTITNPAELGRIQDEVNSCRLSCRLFGQFGEDQDEIPKIILSVNKFVKEEAEGNLIEYSRQMSADNKKPVDMVEKIANNVARMGGSHKGKAWLYLRWMVRKTPDLELFKDFSSWDLTTPFTTPILRVTAALELIDRVTVDALERGDEMTNWWKSQSAKKAHVKMIGFVKDSLNLSFDPARIDYPFFVLGRWLDGFPLNKKFLMEMISFLNNKYLEVERPPIKYLTQNRHYGQPIGAFGSLERSVGNYLDFKKIKFDYEQLEFRLPLDSWYGHGKKTYTPDFILPNVGEFKKVLLEPHGNAERLSEMLKKLSIFKRLYGKYCTLILIMPSEFEKTLLQEYKSETQVCDHLWHDNNYERNLDNFLNKNN